MTTRICAAVGKMHEANARTYRELAREVASHNTKTFHRAVTGLQLPVMTII